MARFRYSLKALLIFTLAAGTGVGLFVRSRHRRSAVRRVYQAARRGDVDDLRAILDVYPDFLNLKEGGRTLLHSAASGGQVGTLTLLIARGSDASALDYRRRTPLHCAADSGSAEACAVLLDAGADIDALDQNANTPLGTAVMRNVPLRPPASARSPAGSARAAGLLLERGADPNAVAWCDGAGGKQELTMLLAAMGRRRRDVVMPLLKHGADPNARAGQRKYPLDRAISGNWPATALALVEAGAELAHGNHQALRSAAGMGMTDVVRLMVAKGAPVDATSKGRTALYFAVRGGKLETVRALLALGADIKGGGTTSLRAGIRSCGGKMALVLLAAGAKGDYRTLCEAARAGRTDLVRALLDAGAPANGGDTALCAAAERGHLEVVKMLIAAGADPARGSPAVHAARAGHTEILRFIAARVGPLAGDISLAVALGKVDAVADRLKREPELVRKRDKEGWTLLHIACLNRQPGIALMLIEAGAEVNAERKRRKTTPLECAVMSVAPGCAKILLENGADIGVRSTGCTPIQRAAAKDEPGADELVKVLIDGGASLEDRCSSGWTPLWRAARFGTKETAKVLLEAGADPASAWTPRRKHADVAAGPDLRKEIDDLIRSYRRERPEP